MTPHLQLHSIERIWDKAPHNAFPDLVQWHGQIYCALREGEGHESGRDGVVVILRLGTDQKWHLAERLHLANGDLRDPKLSVAPDGTLYLVAGAARRDNNGHYLRFDTVIRRCATDGKWDKWHTLEQRGWWLWKVTWHQNRAYGIAYFLTDPTQRDTPWKAALWRSEDGFHYTEICTIELGSYPSEASVLFTSSQRMVAVVRRGQYDEACAWLGESSSPYQEWTWHSLEQHVAAPDLCIASPDCLWITGRLFTEGKPRTFLGRLVQKKLHVDHLLPSSGDNSYPSLLQDTDGTWLLAYYSSHERNTAIYLARFHTKS